MSQPDFAYVTYIETTAEKLWNALTDPELSKQYWWGTRVTSDWKVGSDFALVLNGKTTDAGKVLAFERPRRLSYTFQAVLSETVRAETPSCVSFVLEPNGTLVKLTLTHDGFAPGSLVLDGISKGWPAIMSSLKSMLEGGHALVIPLACLDIEGVG